MTCDGSEDVQRVQPRLWSSFGSTPHLLCNSREAAQFSKPSFLSVLFLACLSVVLTVMSKYDDNNIVIS